MKSKPHQYIVKYKLNGQTRYVSDSDPLSEGCATAFGDRRDAERAAAELAVKGARGATIVKIGLRRA